MAWGGQEALQAAERRVQEAGMSDAEATARLSLLRQQHAEAAASAQTAHADACSLRQALTACEKRLLDAQRRDAKACS